MKDEQFLLFSKPKNEFETLWEAIEELKASQAELCKQLVDVQTENKLLQFHTKMKPTLRWTA